MPAVGLSSVSSWTGRAAKSVGRRRPGSPGTLPDGRDLRPDLGVSKLGTSAASWTLSKNNRPDAQLP